MPWIRNVTGSEMIADSGATSYFDSIDEPYNDFTNQAADNYNVPAYWPVHQGETRFSDTSPEYIEYLNQGAYNVPNTMNGPVISVRTSSSGPQHEHIKYTDENGGTVEEWRSHSAQTDPHTGQVIGTASNYNYEYTLTQVMEMDPAVQHSLREVHHTLVV
nr:uncharacterized protein LOC109415686 isoform X2 [Aedes albopictus]